MPTTIDYKNLFMNEKGQQIENLVHLIEQIKGIAQSDSTPVITIQDPNNFNSPNVNIYDDLCAQVQNTLNEIFSQKTCAGISITSNIDNTIFGIVVNPTISNVDLMSILLDNEPMSISRYQVEIDDKVFRVLDSSEITAYLLYNIECTVSEFAIENTRNHIAYILNKNGADIDIKSSINYSNILIFGIKDAIARSFDLISGTEAPEDAFLVSIRDKVNSELSDFSSFGKDPNMSILDWCLLVYKDLKTEYKDAIDILKQSKDLTGSKLRKDEMDRLIKSLGRASQEAMMESAVRQELNEAKGFSLFKGLKKNGLRSIEEDLYEYKIRAKNCTDQSDAIYIIRCINTRIGILEDYLATTPELPDYEIERWQGLINDYRELRAFVSAKKFRSASANFNSFLNIDYDAIDRKYGYTDNDYE